MADINMLQLSELTDCKTHICRQSRGIDKVTLAKYRATYVTLSHTEGYPSGLRGWFAKSLVRGDLEREFESPLLRQNENRILVVLFSF
jgi:hypothetical protein